MRLEFDRKEVTWIIIAIIIFTFIIIFPIKNPNPFLLAIPTIIILTNVITKKYAADYFNIKIKYTIWQWKQYYLPTKAYFKKPIPIGLILPFFLAFVSLGLIKMLAFLQFDYENNERKRLLKRTGRIRREEINETDPAFTVAWGFYALLILAVIGAIIRFPELAKYSIYYGAWNMLPIGGLDGTKLFFGNLFNWIVLAIIFFIAIIATIGL